MSTDPQYDREEAVRRAVVAVIRVDDPANLQFEERPPFPGATFNQYFPKPLAGIKAALYVSNYARRELRDRHIRAAREAGHTWEEIGEALGLGEAAKEYDQSIGEAAWRYAASGRYPGEPPSDFERRYEPYVGWRCPSCNELVRETVYGYGLEYEQGHADGCARYTAALAAEQARREESENRPLFDEEA